MAPATCKALAAGVSGYTYDSVSTSFKNHNMLTGTNGPIYEMTAEQKFMAAGTAGAAGGATYEGCMAPERV